MKKVIPYKLIIKLSVVSLLLAFFVVMVGGSMNPLMWKQQFERRQNPTMLLEPTSPTIKKLNEGFEASYGHILKFKTQDLLYGYAAILTKEDLVLLDRFTLEVSNIYIQSQVGYKTDIGNYHSIDHFATSSEIIQRGADDCDGQAILIASLLRYRGYDAYVVVGYSHVWVDVHLDDRVISINNPERSDVWYCKFDERNVQWSILPFFILFMGFFMLFYSLLSVLYYLYKKNVLEYIRDYMYVFKYVFFLLVTFLGFGVIVFVIIKIVIP
ncbi:MAG: hypothetical protein KAT49_07505 [Methanomicrobia archaeon]|nr:hypothetical protein [Methanomicrobia archaeon]